MIPLIIAAIGGYFIGDGLKNPVLKFADGGSIDGIEIEYSQDGISFINYMRLLEHFETYEQKGGEDFDFEKYNKSSEAAEKAIQEWADKNNALIFEFWNEDEGYASARFTADIEATKLAKKQGKSIAIMEYNS